MSRSRNDLDVPLARRAARVFLALSVCWVMPGVAGVSDDLRGLIENKGPRLVVVLVDTSDSIREEEWKEYRRSLDRLLDAKRGIEPGDRIVLGRISGYTIANFHADYDEEIAKTDVPRKDRENLKQARGRIIERFESIRKEHKTRPATSTNIMEGFRIAADIFRRKKDGGPRWLVVLSDMVEESSEYNFKRERLTPEYLARIIERQKRERSLPGLKGVRIEIGGAGGQVDPAKAYEIRGFWLGYLKASEASVSEENYGRSGIGFLR